MAHLLNQRIEERPDDDESPPYDLIVQVIQGALLCVVLWYALKVVLREPGQRATPAPDAHWSVATISRAGTVPGKDNE